MSGASSGRVMRHLPGDSPIHRMWAGTKILWVPIVGSAIAFSISWTAIGIGWLVVLATFLLARLPRGVVPKPPKVLLIAVGISFFLALLSNDEPAVYGVGVGGVADLARFLAFAWMMTAMALLIGWTTKLDDLAAALDRLLRPLRRLGVPVDEISTVITMAVRSVPLVADEMRTLLAARRLRPQDPNQPYVDTGVDLGVALVVSTFRRAREMGRTLASRGGVRRPPSDRHRLSRIDLVAGLLGAALVGGIIAFT
ncbi:MAG: energy-coupling factor transporter transmembrane protein EcfT [Acidimicrobiales bacterium]